MPFPRLILLDHHHGALLLASSAAAHHDDIRAVLSHLVMLREPLTHCKYHVLLWLLGIGGLLSMHLLHIDHLVLRCLNVDELVIRAHLLMNGCEWRWGSDLTPAVLEHLVSNLRRGHLLLSRRGSIIIILIIHSEG